MDGGRLVIAMTGASGSGYGVELIKGLQKWRDGGGTLSLIMTQGAGDILRDECGLEASDLRGLVDEAISSEIMEHPLASGSNSFSALVICPCTASTASKIASGIADNLITRMAAVALKEMRRIILVLRETPLSTPVLRSLYDLSSWGVLVMPASPPFYGSPESPADLQRCIAGRVMDRLEIDNDLAERYTP